MLKHTHTYPALVPRPLAAAISDDDHKTFHRPLGLMLPEDAEAELSWPHRAAQKAGTMEQLPALSTVLCTVLLIPIGGAGLRVLQSPADLRASPGETVTLNCSFENTQGSMAKATWTRAPRVVLDSAHPFYRGRLSMSHLDLLQKGEATLTLSELELRDSGLYQCHISIRKGESGTGAGTELLVTGRNQSDTDKVPAPSGSCARELLYQVTIALGLLLILGLVATLLLKRHRGTKPEPSPR
ncbi:natural cytotoxicity triggering receptor 3-like isoform X1 [Chelonoidis abingdonii]|uniref:natural cytotoxicity triggering receptor 3-like isoform X1 n=1 Tax=Chelonoidis abingdonii TaxID=106734 RepID=UPI003F49348C